MWKNHKTKLYNIIPWVIFFGNNLNGNIFLQHNVII